MKIRFLKNCSVDVETKTGEVYSKGFYRWDTVEVDMVCESRGYATLQSNQGFLLNVPAATFERLIEKKCLITL